MWIYANDRLWNLDKFAEICLYKSTVRLIDDERYVHNIDFASVERATEIYQEIVGKLTNCGLIFPDAPKN